MHSRRECEDANYQERAMAQTRHEPFQCYAKQHATFKHPATAVVAGPSGSGKTTFLMSLIEHKSTAFTPEPSRIILCYKQFQPAYEKLLSRTDVQLVQGCKGYTLCPDTRTLLIIDDFSSESEEASIGELFSVSSHHLNTSVFYVTHNLFLQTRAFRLTALNAQYYVLFKSIRGAGQIATLARQVFAGQKGKGKRLMEAYSNTTRTPFSYLVLDLHPETPEAMRFRSHILPGEGAVLASNRDANLITCYTT